MDKRVVYILGLFLVFFILRDPDVAGPQVRAFFDWLLELGERFGTFLEGLFNDEGAPPAGQ